MTKKWAFIFLVVVGFVIWLRSENRPVEPGTVAPEAVTETTAIQPSTAPSVVVSAEALSEKEIARKSIDTPVVKLAPTAETMRSEVERDPHSPPTSLISFAADLAPKMDEAQKSPAAAEKFFAELQDCLASPKLAQSRTVRALCLVNIRRLGQQIPSMKSRAEAAFAKADPELRDLAR